MRESEPAVDAASVGTVSCRGLFAYGLSQTGTVRGVQKDERENNRSAREEREKMWETKPRKGEGSRFAFEPACVHPPDRAKLKSRAPSKIVGGRASALSKMAGGQASV